MLQTPVRVIQTLRPKIAAGVLTATAVSTIVFSATPFLVRGVSLDQGVDVSTVGVISTAQLAGFSLTTWAAGRYLRARRRMLVIAVLLGAVANLASGWAPWFSVLVVTRVVSGVSLGLIAWIAWAEVFGDDEKVGDVAVIGPARRHRQRADHRDRGRPLGLGRARSTGSPRSTSSRSSSCARHASTQPPDRSASATARPERRPRSCWHWA